MIPSDFELKVGDLVQEPYQKKRSLLSVVNGAGISYWWTMREDKVQPVTFPEDTLRENAIAIYRDGVQIWTEPKPLPRELVREIRPGMGVYVFVDDDTGVPAGPGSYVVDGVRYYFAAYAFAADGSTGHHVPVLDGRVATHAVWERAKMEGE